MLFIYIEMRDEYADMQIIYVDMHVIFVDMQPSMFKTCNLIISKQHKNYARTVIF